jgi:hypothetical protein
LGALHLDIAAAPGAQPGRDRLPVVVARHVIAPDGAGVMVRDHAHVQALEAAAMAAAAPAAPHRRKQRIPPGPEARAAAEALRAAASPATGRVTGVDAEDVVVDLARYAAAATGRNTLPPPPDTPASAPADVLVADQPRPARNA